MLWMLACFGVHQSGFQTELVEISDPVGSLFLSVRGLQREGKDIPKPSWVIQLCTSAGLLYRRGFVLTKEHLSAVKKPLE